MAITTEQVKALRDATGVSIMQCRKALEEANGDMEKATLILRTKSSAIADKKNDRELGSGVIGSYVHNNRQIGVLVELDCETDFVAKNDEFIALANDLAMHVAAMHPEFVSREDITPEARESITNTMRADVANLDKPEEIKAKILEGKVNDFFAGRTLLDQPFVKNPDVTVGTLISQAVQKIGEKIKIGKFSYLSTLSR